MSDYSKYKKLELPKSNEKYDVGVANKNNMVIDSELNKLNIKNQSQDELLATKESLNSEITRATNKENDIIEDLDSEIARAKSAENSNANSITNEVTRATTVEENISAILQEHIDNSNNPHNITKEQLGIENIDNTSDMNKPVSTAQQNTLDTAILTHNASNLSHEDIRLLISVLTNRLNALADSDDTTLDQLSEIVEYIKNNKDLIDGITTSKINVSDIISNLIQVQENTTSGKLVDALVVKEVFQSVSDGKELIASAITDKGVQTDADASFTVMADNIGQIFSYNNIVTDVFVCNYTNHITNSVYSPTTIINRIYVRQPYLNAKLKKIVLTKYAWPLYPNNTVAQPLIIGSYDSSDTVYLHIDFEYYSKDTKTMKTVKSIFFFSGQNRKNSILIDENTYILPQNILDEISCNNLYTNISFRLSRKYNINLETVLGIKFIYE